MQKSLTNFISSRARIGLDWIGEKVVTEPNQLWRPLIPKMPVVANGLIGNVVSCHCWLRYYSVELTLFLR